MKSPFELINPGDARAYLREFPKTLRERGENYFRSGAVEQISVQEPGEKYQVLVRGGANYFVDVFYDDFMGWEAVCNCPYEFGACKHAYAAVKALLEHNQPAVSNKKRGNKRRQPGRSDRSKARACCWNAFGPRMAVRLLNLRNR